MENFCKPTSEILISGPTWRRRPAPSCPTSPDSPFPRVKNDGQLRSYSLSNRRHFELFECQFLAIATSTSLIVNIHNETGKNTSWFDEIFFEFFLQKQRFTDNGDIVCGDIESRMLNTRLDDSGASSEAPSLVSLKKCLKSEEVKKNWWKSLKVKLRACEKC